MLLIEDTNAEQSVLPFVFGLLPGWWLGIYKEILLERLG